MIHIVGVGPAGASLAYYLKDEFKVRGYEMRKSSGAKPCAWAVPRSLKKYIKIPEEAILNEIHGQKIYLNNELLGENYQRLPQGYILNKPAFIKWLLDGVDVKLGKPIKFKEQEPELRTRDGDIAVIATGSIFHNESKWKFLTYQYILKDAKIEDDVIEIRFYTDFVGYIWVFPRENKANVGIGGFLSHDELKARLDSFIKNDERFRYTKIERKEGAHIYAGGIKGELYNFKYPVIGEALGAVYPLTGEGIRPSIISSYAFYRSIKYGKSLREEFEKTGIPQQINFQKQLVEALLKAPPHLREVFIREYFKSSKNPL